MEGLRVGVGATEMPSIRERHASYFYVVIVKPDVFFFFKEEKKNRRQKRLLGAGWLS